MSLPLEATHRGRPVTAGHATPEEVAALMATSPLEAAIDVLEHWSLIAIRGLGGGGLEVHALGWRRALANTWITSALSAIDLAAREVRTSSGHVYRLGRPDSRENLQPALLEHLDYALHRWGFVDLRWDVVGRGLSRGDGNASPDDVESGGCDEQ